MRPSFSLPSTGSSSISKRVRASAQSWRPLVADLSDADLRDLAAYYAYLPRPSDLRPTSDVPPRIVASGAPMRGIVPCGACHGELDSKAGAAWLEGQPAVYLRIQLGIDKSAPPRRVAAWFSDRLHRIFDLANAE